MSVDKDDRDGGDSHPRATKHLRRRWIIVAAGICALVVAALAWIVVSGPLSSPTAGDFASAESQRQVLDVTLEAYEPQLVAFTAQYQFAVSEQLSGTEQDSIQKETQDRFEGEARLGSARLDALASSPALEDEVVAEKFSSFRDAHDAVTRYYRDELAAQQAVSRAVGGACSRVLNLNVGKESYPSDFVAEADDCLTSLDSEKSNADDKTTALLTNLGEMFSERRDLFEKALDGDQFDKNIARITAVLSILDVNGLVEEYSAEYESARSTQYTAVASTMNDASSALKSVLEERLDASAATGKDTP